MKYFSLKMILSDIAFLMRPPSAPGKKDDSPKIPGPPSSQNTKAITSTELEARILQERSTSLTIQLAAEEQMLGNLKGITPQDEVEIKRTEARLGYMSFLKQDAEATIDRLLGKLKGVASPGSEHFVTRDELEARILRDRSTVFTIQLAAEEQVLATLNNATPIDETEIRRTETRFGNLDFLKQEAESISGRLLAELKGNASPDSERLVTPNELEVRILPERSTLFAIQLAAEEQILYDLKVATPIDETEIRRTEVRFGCLDFLKREADAVADRLLGKLKDEEKK